MEYCRAQLACLLIVGYIGFMYFRECKAAPMHDIGKIAVPDVVL